MKRHLFLVAVILCAIILASTTPATLKTSRLKKANRAYDELSDTKKDLSWQWLQTKATHFFDPKWLIPTKDPVTKWVFGPPKVNPLTPNSADPADHANFSGDINLYVLDALRKYIASPGANPIGEIWDNSDDATRKTYGNFLRDYHDAAFWKLVITVSMPDHPANIQECIKGFNFQRDNDLPSIRFARRQFAAGNDIFAMFALMYGQRHNSDACEWYRATFRDDRAAFLALLNQY